MEMPYVRTLHNFRLLNENAMLKRAGIEDNQIGGLTEVYFGLFTDPEDGCRPRLRVKAIQEMTGWKASHAFELPAVFCNRDHGFSHFVFDGEPEEVFDKIAAEFRPFRREPAANQPAPLMQSLLLHVTGRALKAQTHRS